MNVLLIICSLLAVAVAQEPALSCLYFRFAETYGCELTINNPNGFNNFTQIEGIHWTGFTDVDVNLLYRITGDTTNIPQIICDTFPNIEFFEFSGSDVTEIDDSAFRGCSQMGQLYLYYNRISSISSNAFVNLREVLYMNLGENLLTTLPENVFASQRNLTELILNDNDFEDLPAGLFRPLENLQYMHLANLTTINSQWFETNSALHYLYLAANRITMTASNFVGLQHVRELVLSGNGISEIPAGTFAGLTSLQIFHLIRNNFRELRADMFAELGQLIALQVDLNPIETIGNEAFAGLDSLTSLSLSNCRIRELNSNSFNGLNNLVDLDLNFNEIENIPSGTFASMPNLTYVGLWSNRLMTLRRNSFGTLTELQTLDLDNNVVNALDRAVIDDAVNLNTLYFSGNICADNWFGNFLISRATFLPMLDRCFTNSRYIIDITTEAGGIYSFFEGPQPGISLRLQSDNEVQIALTPFDFIWAPSIEIFIGSTNNTQSATRINEETIVVTVPTQTDIIQRNQWNDFRITWARQNVLIFFGNEALPFMSYTMQEFFPVNFYGLRAVETATWSVQPLAPVQSIPPPPNQNSVIP